MPRRHWTLANTRHPVRRARHLGCNEGWRPGALLEGASSWGIMEVYCAGLVADIQQGC